MAPLDPAAVQERIDRFGRLWFIDDIVRHPGRDEKQVPVLGYPRNEHDPSDYEFFTGKQVDAMVDEACRFFVRSGIKVNSRETIGIYAPSDLSYVVTFFALFRLGCRVLIMSARLSPPACLNLLQRADCTRVLHGNTPHIKATLSAIQASRPDVILAPVPLRADFDRPDLPPQPPFEREITDREAEHTDVVFIAHSSGSTGLPKPLFLSHRSLATGLLSGVELDSFNALPLYHLHGLLTFGQAMWLRKKACLFGAHMPLTADSLIAGLRAVRPEVAHLVPYTLKLVAEKQEGIDLLKQCQRVTAAGVRTPDELGNRLVENGVNFASMFGLTEVMHIGDSIHRELGDNEWQYIRIYPHVQPHIYWKPIDGDTHEAVYLESHPALKMSNSDDPPGSYHSSDLFVPHSTIPNAWKYVARRDDTITLMSGEKILPLSIEGAVRESPLVRDVLMVGNDRLMPGLLVLPSQAAAELSEEGFVEAIRPYLEDVNKVVDEFARITPDMVMVLPRESEFPVTDKNNIIRAQAYTKFADVIDALYARAESTDNGSLKLDQQGLERYVMKVVKEQVGVDLPDAQADFFAAGVDSLRAAQIRRLLIRNLDLGGKTSATNVVYDTGNVEALAKLLYVSRTGEELGTNGHSTIDKEIALMEQLIEKYGKFEKRVVTHEDRPEAEVVLLTGATGHLGAHLLHQLLENPSVTHIFALVRGTKPLFRLETSLTNRGLPWDPERYLPKLTALATTNLGAPNLGLASDELFADIQRRTTLVLHIAWPVNFNISLRSFEPHIAALHNLLQLTLSAPSPGARLAFASSVSVAFETPPPTEGSPIIIREGRIPELTHAAATGYGRGKLVGERLCAAAALVGGDARVLRIGQITGDTRRGLWNDAEAPSLMVRSVVELGVLPALEVGDTGECAWMPVDVVARVCLELAGGEVDAVGAVNGHENGHTNGNGHVARNGMNEEDGCGKVRMKGKNGGGKDEMNGHGLNGGMNGGSIGMNGKAFTNGKGTNAHHGMNGKGVEAYFNVVPSRAFSWAAHFLPALRRAGLDFDTVPTAEWLARLRARGEELGPDAEDRLPAVKLADYFETTYMPDVGGQEPKTARFANERTSSASTSLRLCPDVVESGLVGKLVATWFPDVTNGH